MDYKELLKKYMAYICDMDGYTYTSMAIADKDKFTRAEREALREIAEGGEV